MSSASALQFEVEAKFNNARCATLTLPHGPCRTPMFMPVGTQAAMKGLLSHQMEDLDVDLMLSNTYWLSQNPGADVVASLGGLHKMMGWVRNILTDSGGFQMVSLLELSSVNEDGVTFKSPKDGKMTLLTPEESIGIQNKLGADIIMALDDVVPSTLTGPRVSEAQERTIRWLDRCYDAHKRPHDQNLFAIVQGGLDLNLRRKCVEAFIERDSKIPGYAIGGLSGGEEKDIFWRIVQLACSLLPPNKPRYVMGVGYPVDILICSALGADMFDCVYPARTARFGTALSDVPGGVLKLRSDQYAEDPRVIDPGCKCYICRGAYTRARLHQLACKEGGGELITYHNIAYMMNLTSRLRTSLRSGEFPSFVRWYIRTIFPRRIDCPQWVCNALVSAGISKDVKIEWYPQDEQIIIGDQSHIHLKLDNENKQNQNEQIPIQSPYHVKERNIHGASKQRNIKIGDNQNDEINKDVLNVGKNKRKRENETQQNQESGKKRQRQDSQ
ncbi:MAG: putative Queuine tRNA-ribosyltransferase catalytic subunit 1 [Streblomastix strix]|uniref:Queuine tRNA-ribosyltransferase catalytic subunit 1 n=1 Tax=Streblomastix strix TaxID=222440 RepID=A0A5J4UW55_9EUKA|nr:MAG: putative Queuine tRNA-ribosyltransferase catalytic subunit 1 [Streblomastix strix]